MRQLHLHCATQMAAAASNTEDYAAVTTPKKGEQAAPPPTMDCFLSKKITNKVVTQLQVRPSL